MFSIVDLHSDQFFFLKLIYSAKCVFYFVK